MTKLTKAQIESDLNSLHESLRTGLADAEKRLRDQKVIIAGAEQQINQARMTQLRLEGEVEAYRDLCMKLDGKKQGP